MPCARFAVIRIARRAFVSEVGLMRVGSFSGPVSYSETSGFFLLSAAGLGGDAFGRQDS